MAIQTLKTFYRKNEIFISMTAFLVGFIVDIFTLGRIDSLLVLIKHAFYLIILCVLLLIEIKVNIGRSELGQKGKKFWEYHDPIIHFLFGSLLSAHTIFYFTSASALTSFLYIGLLAGLMLANEIPKIRKTGVPVRVILFNICLLSYFSFFYPILFGKVGVLPFWLGFFSSALIMALVWQLNFKAELKALLRSQVLFPAIAVHLFFLLAYSTSLIPPVPVAVKKIGVYYHVEKKGGHYLGLHLNPAWKVWDKGSQEFFARSGDKVVILLSIFSPARFEDKIYLRWYYHDPKSGWRLEDSIPLSILGGREEGFRGFGSKQFYKIGDWRVLVETSDGREVGRIGLSIKEDTSLDERHFSVDQF